MIAVFSFALGCAADISAQSVPRVGGFKSIPVDNKDVVRAADFAVKAISESEEITLKLDSIVKAEYQIVQGKKYKLFLQTLFITEDDESLTMCVTAEVYHDLKDEFHLSKWEESECPSEE
jgi:hypothetical protein